MTSKTSSKLIPLLATFKKPYRYRHGREYRCDICGKFIGYTEIDKDEVIIENIPDTEYTAEHTTMTHKKCC